MLMKNKRTVEEQVKHILDHEDDAVGKLTDLIKQPKSRSAEEYVRHDSMAHFTDQQAAERGYFKVLAERLALGTLVAKLSWKLWKARERNRLIAMKCDELQQQVIELHYRIVEVKTRAERKV